MSKIGYSIGEVADFLDVEAHTIRFWVNELSSYISPQIGAGGRRYFSQDDVEFLKQVKQLTYHDGIKFSSIKKNGLNFKEKIVNTEKNTEDSAVKIELIEKIENEIEKMFAILNFV